MKQYENYLEFQRIYQGLKKIGLYKVKIDM